MNRIGFLLKVKQDRIDEYKEHHRNVWPEMLDALRRNGWRNYSLYMKEDGALFGYFETDGDLQSAVDAMAREEVNTKWQELMAPFFETPDGTKADEILIELEEVFHTD